MNKKNSSADASTVKVVVKALRALDFLVEAAMDRPGASLGEVAEAVGIRSTTARNILKTMEMCGYVGRVENRLYCPGARCAALFRASMAGPLAAAGRDVAVRLSEQTGESIVLTTLAGGDRRVLLRAAGSNVVCVNSQQVESERFYALVTGRVMLAFASEGERELVFQRHGMPGRAWDGLADGESVERELAAICEAGFAEDRPSPESAALAVPVLDPRRRLLGAIGAHVPAFRFGPERREAILAALRDASTVLVSKLMENAGAV